MNDIDMRLLRKVDLNSLVVLQALLDSCSVSQSAKRLCLGQPAVSQQLKRLRELFADELLCRYGREMRLTPLAESLRAPLAQWLAHGQQLLQPQADFDPLHVQAEFRLAMPDLLEAALLPLLISHFQHNAPDLKLTVWAMPSQEVEHAFEQGRIDGALGYFTHLSSRVMRERLFVCGFVCVYHPARVRLPASLRLRDLAQVAHITTSYSSLSVSMIDSQLQAQGLERRVIASCASLLAIPAVLEQVCAVAVLPDIIARAISSAQSPLQLQPVVDSPPAIQIEYVWHPRLTHDPLHNWIRHQLRSLAPRCAMEPPLQQ